MNEDLVSVVIPTYGRPTTLLRAIESALSQTYPCVEIIVVDDNNPESLERKDTENVLLKIKDNRVKYIKHDQNKNGAAARNTGVKYSSGRYIAFLDDDDEFKPHKIERQLEYLQKNKHFKLVYCKTEFYKKNKLYYRTTYNKEGNIQYDILTMHHECNSSSIFIYKSALESVGGFNESFIRHQDYELLLKLNQHFDIGCVEDYLLKRHNDDKMNQPSVQQYIAIKQKFLDEFVLYINSFEEIKRRTIYKIHLFDIAYYGFKNKDFKVFIKYLLNSKPNLKVIRYAFAKIPKLIKLRIN